MIAMAASDLPLSGVKVADFSHFVAGPAAASLLVALGATVTKIESPEGEAARSLGADRALFRAWNCGKRSLALDLKTAEGREIARRVVQDSDVVLESFRRGTMERLGLGYETVRRDNPSIVYASVSGFGHEGPERDRRAVDAVIQAESGMMHTTGERGGSPLKVGFQPVDTASGLALSNTILAALLRRQRTGEGQRISLSLFDVALFLQGHTFTAFSMSGEEPDRCGNRVPYGYPTDMFHTSDGAIQLAAYSPGHWALLCRVLDITELEKDGRFETLGARIRNSEELHTLLEKVFMMDTTDAWVQLLLHHGLMVGEVNSYASVMKKAESVSDHRMNQPAGRGWSSDRSRPGPGGPANAWARSNH